MAVSPGIRRYQEAEVAAFFRTSDRFGALSNMARGFPLKLTGIDVPSSEALYQALRFPHLPEFQAEILTQASPILSKRHAYTRVSESRPDWLEVNVAAMRYVLRLKWACHPEKIADLMRETADRPIVEISSRDAFWGTKRENGMLVGSNVLGRLLMELRGLVLEHDPGLGIDVEPPGKLRAQLLGRSVLTEKFPSIRNSQQSFDL